MNPAARLSVALLLGLALWLPSLGASMRGEIDMPTAALRFLVAFLFARVAVAGVSWLLDSYSGAAEADQGADDGAGSEEHHRRADDLSTATGLS